jgi:branched-chain amino acid transport system substrate-binding protein
VAVFYNPGDRYSQSLRDQFQTDFTSGGGKIVDEEFDLSNPLFNPAQTVDKAQTQGATVLVLFPNTSTRDRAIKVSKANRGRYCMVGGDTVYNSQTLKEAGREVVGSLVVATFWHTLKSPNPLFREDAENLWQAVVSPRTALAYDATRAVIEALKTLPEASRLSVQKALADPKFNTIGATGNISFDNNGDRKERIIQLVAVVPSINNSAYEFVPIDDPRVRLNCQ